MYVAYNNSKKNENNKKNRERCDREGSRAQKTKDLEWKRDRKKQQKKAEINQKTSQWNYTFSRRKVSPI